MNIIAIDPGPEESAYVVYEDGKFVIGAKVPNEEMLSGLRSYDWKNGGAGAGLPTVVIEQIAAMGMAVGAEVFETCVWTGRFMQVWTDRLGAVDRVKRMEVKMALCASSRAKDANIRQALIDRFGPGKTEAIGTKRKPGPLYGVSGDVWSALAVAVVYSDRNAERLST